jgi:arylsulfatase A-like enzyme
LLIGSSLACSNPADLPEPRHLVLISIDTLRADYLSAYGHPFTRSPHIDTLAEQGLVFENHIASAPTTLASHTSLMTGTWPHTHGAPRNGFVVAPDNVMLAEVLARHGFETAGFVSAFPLSARFGFDQGFEHWDDELNIDKSAHPGQFEQSQRSADQVTNAAIAWLPNPLADERLFLFVHYFDVHAPYVQPAPFDRMYREDGLRADGSYATIKRARRELRKKGSTPLNEVLKRSYAAGISYVDHELGRLLDALAEGKILDDAVVVITSDHGEAMDEHSELWDHGFTTYESATRIPLIVRLPPGGPAGARPRALVSNIDVMPSLLELLGVPIPAGVEGLSFAAAFGQKELAEHREAAFSEATKPYDTRHEAGAEWQNERKFRSIRTPRWKLVRRPLRDQTRLFDLSHDPREQRDLSGQRPKLTMKLRSRLEAWSAEAHPKGVEHDLDPEVKSRLEALGYVDEPEPGD